MSKLYYDIPISEERYEKKNKLWHWKETYHVNLPHAKEIAEYLPAEWDKCKIGDVIERYNPVFKDKIASCTMKCRTGKDGELVARVTVEFVRGFRLSREKRGLIWDELDAQMSDGFGESFDRSTIPGVDNEWRIAF